MRRRGRPIRVRTMLAAVAAFAVAFAAIREAAVRLETREFITFHEQRARWLRVRAARLPPGRDEIGGPFLRYAAWHDRRAVFYRRAHKTDFSDEMIEDLRQTEREQEADRALAPYPAAGNPAPAPTNGTRQ